MVKKYNKFNPDSLTPPIVMATQRNIRAFVNKVAPKRKRPSKAKRLIPKRIYSFINPGFKMACIALKYGSFTDLDHPRLTNG